MNASDDQNHRRSGRQIVGFSLDPEMAREVKMEAARRNISLKKLFEELWEIYKQPAKAEPSDGR